MPHNLVVKPWKIPRESFVFSPPLRVQRSWVLIAERKVAVAVATEKGQMNSLSYAKAMKQKTQLLLWAYFCLCSVPCAVDLLNLNDMIKKIFHRCAWQLIFFDTMSSQTE